MIEFRKHIWLVFLSVFMVALEGPRPAYAANSDISAVSGQGSTNNIDIWRIDSNYNMHLATSNAHDLFKVDGSTGGVSIWSGDMILQGSLSVATSSVVGTYPGYKIPFFNGSNQATVQGNVIIATNTSTADGGVMGMANLTATTTVMGICDGVYPANTMGFMTVGGYALVLTTGNVAKGQLLVSSQTIAFSNTGVSGYAGGFNGNILVSSGTAFGRALNYRSTEGLTLAIIGRY